MKFKLIKEELSNLHMKQTTLKDNEAQKLLHTYKDDLPLFKYMIEKGISNTNMPVSLFFDNNNEFIGYIVSIINFYKFNKKKQLDAWTANKSAFNTINISDVEVRDSIRKDKSRPRYGKEIIDDFLQSMKSQYDGITLEAAEPPLIDYYARYGFQLIPDDMKHKRAAEGDVMVLWF